MTRAAPAQRPPPPKAGEMAPDATLTDAAGAAVPLSDLWEAAPRALVLVFLRHFG